VFSGRDDWINQYAPVTSFPGEDFESLDLAVDLPSTRGKPDLGSNDICGTLRSSQALISRGWFSRFV
jgi:hypothetical protein